MEVNIANAQDPLPVDRAHAVSMVVRSFKGRRNVEVHLFRHQWDETEMEAVNWDNIIGPPLEGCQFYDPGGSRKVVLEAFTSQERDQIVEFLKEQYGDRLLALNASPLQFPVPQGLTPLSEVPSGKDVGLILFEKIPSYSLDIPLHGLYDLSLHKPLVSEKEQS
jgi:hypothetical protein